MKKLTVRPLPAPPKVETPKAEPQQQFSQLLFNPNASKPRDRLMKIENQAQPPLPPRPEDTTSEEEDQEEVMAPLALTSSQRRKYLSVGPPEDEAAQGLISELMSESVDSSPEHRQQNLQAMLQYLQQRNLISASLNSSLQ